MATIGNSYLGLADVYRRKDKDNQYSAVIEMLNATNEWMQDVTTLECNNGSKHKTTLRTSLPSTSWGKLYQGVPQSKSGTAQVEDATGFVEGLSTVDTRLLKLSQNEKALRLSEAQAYLEAMEQNVSTQMFYGNQDLNPERFTGLAPRFNSLSGETGGQVVNGGGSGSDNTSIWFVTWSDNACHMIYPQGQKAGIERDDKGEQRVTDDSGNAYYVKEEMFTWHCGLTVRDYRQVSRVANIDVSDLLAGNVDVWNLMTQAMYKIRRHRLPGAKMAIYCNNDVLYALDRDSTPTKSTGAGNNTGIRLQRSEAEGGEIVSYRGIPIRQVDAILNTEAVVS